MNAERRQLTILNCDIFGSSVYADSLDPEDFASLLSVFFSTCNKVVGSCGGTLAQNSGDGILAYFGYPKTHGQDARDAIECGKLIVEALAAESKSMPDNFQVRIGITTGLVVLTDVQVQHGKSDRIAIGSAAHRSERVQRLAAGGEVLVDDATRKLSERYYEFTDRGMHELKGFTKPSQVWGVGMPRPVMSRFEERGPSLAPIVGRDSEMELLSVLWSQAREGKGWATYISGEPGIGKSRLAFEFAQQNAPHVEPIVLQCLRGHENAPLHPWLNYINQIAEVGPVDSMAERRHKVGAILSTAFPEQDWLPSFVLQLLTQGSSKQDSSSATQAARAAGCHC
jgi:class 3 adenylate cyclase